MRPYLQVSAALASDAFEQHFAGQERRAPAVWDLAQLPCLRSAVQLLRSGLPTGGGGGGDAQRLQASQVQMALAAAANSSTAGRRTPLCFAAEAGEFAAPLLSSHI